MLRANSKPKRIAIVDCNNFYASAERVFTPAWEHRPVGVLSNNDGCIIARSQELKDAGIKMGSLYFKVREQLEAMNAVIVSSNYALYGDMSARVMDTLSQFTPDIEIYSIDEAWLDLTGFNPATLDAYGREIVATTHRSTGIPVSMGIGPTKTLAKIASRICKKRKIPGNVFNIGSADSLEKVLGAIDVEDIWGIGRRWAEKLRREGIMTALDLRNSDIKSMRSRYNVVMERVISELRGTACIGEEEIAPKKQIMSSRSFGQRVTAKEHLSQALAQYASRACEKLRAQGSVCGAMQVSIRTGLFSPKETPYSKSIVVQFEHPTCDTRRVIAGTRFALDRIFRAGPRYAKAGIMLMDIAPNNGYQLDLFNPITCAANDDELMNTLDKLNQRFGRKTVFFAAQGVKQPWAMKRNFLTKAFTTRWSDIPIVK